jgi:hypothetical protein
MIEDRIRASKDDVVMMEAHLVAERADLNVAEINAKCARRKTAP